ncbi:MAG: hypothetical protein ACFE7R_02505 [Candidatus Hodarchaeota archaeon]
MTKSSDDIVSMQIATAVSKTCESSPGMSVKYSDVIFQALENLSDRKMTDDEEETMITSAATILFNTQTTNLLADQSTLKEKLPLVMKYLGKDGSVKWPAYAVVSQVSSENPVMLQDYAGELIQLIGKGATQLVITLPYLYKLKPDEFERNIDTLLQIYRTNPNAKSTILTVLLEISKKRTDIIEPHLKLFASGLMSPISASPCSMILGEVARVNPQAVHPYLKDLKQSLDQIDVVKYTIPNVLGLIGRSSEETAREVLPILSDQLKAAEANVAMMVLSEFRNLGEMNRELLEPYMDLIRGFSDDPEEGVRGQANLIIDFMEGRDLRSLAAQIEEQNALIREAAVSVDALKEYVDKNVEILKQFIADVNKKLPVPMRFSLEGRLRKTLQLHFVCGLQSERCLYPEDRPFITETQAWNKWLKIAMSAVKLGKAMIFPIEGGAIDVIREAYSIYRADDDQDFLTYIREPFLTSTEQDNLVNQLRDARYFEVFNYDAQNAKWACLMCRQS